MSKGSEKKRSNEACDKNVETIYKTTDWKLSQDGKTNELMFSFAVLRCEDRIKPSNGQQKAARWANLAEIIFQVSIAKVALWCLSRDRAILSAFMTSILLFRH